MSGHTIPRAECITGARAALDQARLRLAADYAAGLLGPEQAALYERLLTRARPAHAA